MACGQPTQTAIVVGLAALIALGAQGCSKTCTLIGCDDGIWVSAAVRRPLEEVERSTITTCYNGACKTSRALDPEAAVLRDYGGGWTGLSLAVHSPETPRNDGDVVRVAIVGSDGRTVMDVVRVLTIHPRPNPNGEACGDDCRYAQAQLYENSPSGLKCENASVMISVGAEVSLRSLRDFDARTAKLTFCRNAACATSTKTLGWSDHALAGDLAVKVFASSTSLTFTMTPRPWELRDDDRYSVKIVDTTLGKVLFSQEREAGYATSYPNGKDCDVYPSRTASIVFQ